MSQQSFKNASGRHSSSHASEVHAISSQNQRSKTPKKPGINSSQDVQFKQTPIDKQIIKQKQKRKNQVIPLDENKSSQPLQQLNTSKPTKLHQSLLQLTNRYKLLGKIGQGGFGFIYKALKIDSGCSVAIKFERQQGPSQSSRRLESEAHLLKMLTETKEYGFPKFIEFKQMKDFSYLIMELLGLNLEQLLKFSSHQKFSLKTVCMIGLEMLDRLKAVHNNQYVYRDVKPENVVVGDQMDFRNLYLIDLGLAKSYKNVQGKHIEEIQRKGLVGFLYNYLIIIFFIIKELKDMLVLIVMKVKNYQEEMIQNHCLICQFIYIEEHCLEQMQQYKIKKKKENKLNNQKQKLQSRKFVKECQINFRNFQNIQEAYNLNNDLLMIIWENYLKAHQSIIMKNMIFILIENHYLKINQDIKNYQLKKKNLLLIVQ